MQGLLDSTVVALYLAIAVLPTISTLAFERGYFRTRRYIRGLLAVAAGAVDLFFCVVSVFAAASDPVTLFVVPVALTRQWSMWRAWAATTPSWFWSSVSFLCSAGLIAPIVLPTMIGTHHAPARVVRARSDVSNLAKAIDRMRKDTGNTSAACLTDITANLWRSDAPADCSGDGGLLNCLTATPGYVCWGGPYIPTVTNDPWNHPYTVTLDAATNLVEVFSRGPDGVPSEDDITFIQ